jgi:hypothetical protein
MIRAARHRGLQDLADLEAASPDALPGLSREFARAVRYHREGGCDAMRLLREGGPALHARRAALQGLGRRASVWYCLRDQLAPANHGRYLEQLLPRARAFRFDKGHLGIFRDLQVVARRHSETRRHSGRAGTASRAGTARAGTARQRLSTARRAGTARQRLSKAIEIPMSPFWVLTEVMFLVWMTADNLQQTLLWMLTGILTCSRPSSG